MVVARELEMVWGAAGGGEREGVAEVASMGTEEARAAVMRAADPVGVREAVARMEAGMMAAER